MRIIHFTNNYLPRISGVARAVYNYKIGLEKLGHKVIVVAPKYSAKTKTSFDQGIIRVSSLRLGNLVKSLNYPIPLSSFKKLAKLCSDFKPQIIHSHHPFFLGKMAQKLALKYKLPLVYTYHTPYFEYFKTKYLPGLSLILQNRFKSLVKNYIKHCHIIIVPAPMMKNKLNLDFNSPSQIKVLPTPIDINLFSEPRHDFIRRKYQLKPTDLILLTVSRLSYEKNLFLLLDVFAEVKKQFKKNLYLVIVGDGYLKPLLVLKAKNLRIEKQVIFTGQVNYESLPHYYAGADVFIYAGLFDSQGLVISEAMVCGLPIVVLDKFGSIKYFIKHGQTGLLSKTKENFICDILSILNNPSLRKTISLNQLTKRTNFSLEKISKDLEQIYANLISLK